MTGCRFTQQYFHHNPISIMKFSEDDLPPATPRTRPITRSLVARPLSPTTAIPPFTPAPRRHVSRINVTPHHGGTPAPAITAPSTLAFATPNYYDPIKADIFEEPPPPGGNSACHLKILPEIIHLSSRRPLPVRTTTPKKIPLSGHSLRLQ